MDKITIENLEVFCHHGVLKEENVLGQKFLVSLSMYMDLAQAGEQDMLELSIDYSEVAHFIEQYMKDHTYKLIESVAEHLAKQILLKFQVIDHLTLTIKKPWAPILLPIDVVSTKINRGWHTAYLSLGSNMGDRQSNINEAIKSFEEDEYCQVTAKAELIETKPYGYTEQDDFINTAIKVRTLYSANELLQKIQQVEEQGKRERTIHWGPRTIDVDIIFYDDMVCQTEQLTIPHPQMHLREFVLKPLAQIAPWTKHPIFHRSVTELLMEVKND